MSARIQAESSRRPKTVPVSALPHERIRHQDVGVRVADVSDGVPSRRGPEIQISGLRTDEDVAVVRAAAAVVNAEGVLDWD